jgi:hypothetical protein
MKKIIIIPALIFIIAITFSCNSGSPKAVNTDVPAAVIKNVPTAETAQAYYYTCSMHPEVRSDKPGKCPICGMDLIKVEINKTDSSQVK